MAKIKTLHGLEQALSEAYRNEHGRAMVRIAAVNHRPRGYCLTVHPAIAADLLHNPSAPCWGQALFTRAGTKAELLAELASPATRPSFGQGASLVPVRIGDTFAWNDHPFTRLPDAKAPRWLAEPFVIRFHGRPEFGEPAQEFEQGQAWFKQRGFVAV
ncbi:MAG: hypothetical protein AAFX65_07400 [Cyanobacteria bacterium J06638_7]